MWVSRECQKTLFSSEPFSVQRRALETLLRGERRERSRFSIASESVLGGWRGAKGSARAWVLLPSCSRARSTGYLRRLTVVTAPGPVWPLQARRCASAAARCCQCAGVSRAREAVSGEALSRSDNAGTQHLRMLDSAGGRYFMVEERHGRLLRGRESSACDFVAPLGDNDTKHLSML